MSKDEAARDALARLKSGARLNVGDILLGSYEIELVLEEMHEDGAGVTVRYIAKPLK